jgi:PAS domain-containing protein
MAAEIGSRLTYNRAMAEIPSLAPFSEQILNSISEGIVVLSEDAHILAVNPAARRLFDLDQVPADRLMELAFDRDMTTAPFSPVAFRARLSSALRGEEQKFE